MTATDTDERPPPPSGLPWPSRGRALLAVGLLLVAVLIFGTIQTYTTVVIHHQRTQISHLKREISRLDQLLHVTGGTTP